MNTANLRRIQNEIDQIRKRGSEYDKMFSIDMVNDDVYNWKAIIYGPNDSLYEGYKFNLDIKLSHDYPYSPIGVKFITPIRHVNINTHGDICLDILKHNWTPSQNIQSIMLSIYILLSEPNIEDPLNSDLAKLYRTNKQEYENSIKQFCQITESNIRCTH